MNSLPYSSIPSPPVKVSATTILIRLVDGLAFRYRWATEGLRPEDADFRPGPDSMTLLEQLRHILELLAWVNECFGGKLSAKSEQGKDIESVRRETMDTLISLRARLEKMKDPELQAVEAKHPSGVSFPFWNLINGPLADTLTHVGQINAWRRLAGNPTPRVSVFQGRPSPGRQPSDSE